MKKTKFIQAVIERISTSRTQKYIGQIVTCLVKLEGDKQNHKVSRGQ